MPAAAALTALAVGVIAGGPQAVQAAYPRSAASAAARPPGAEGILRTLDLVSFGDPLPGAPIVSPFGLRQLPWEERARLHAGVDIVAPEGAEVQAIGYGVVTRTGADSGYGRYVEVQHLGGLTSFYAHLSAVEPRVTPGRTVGPGEVLGRVGNTGSSTGAHLHFEMRNARGRPLDPAFFIGKHFARAEDWPLRAAAKISPEVRIAFVSNIPESKLALMIARQEAAADEAETRALAEMDAAELVEAKLAVDDAANAPAPPEPAEDGAKPAEATGTDMLRLEVPAPVVEAPPPPPPEPPPHRPTVSRLARPD